MAAPRRLGFGMSLCLCAAIVATAQLLALAQGTSEVTDPLSVPTLHPDVTTISLKGRHYWVSVEEGEGSLWACDMFVKCFRIDTRTSPAELIPLRWKKMDSLAMGFGSLWVGVPKGTDAGLHRVNPKTNEETALIPVGGSVFIADGSVWVQEWKANLLVRVDPKTNQVTAKIPDEWKSVAGALLSNAISPAMGSVWVLRKEGIASRIDPETNQSLAEIRIGQRRMERLDLTNYYDSLVAGEGAVWITEHITDGKLIKVEASTNQVVARTPVGYQPGSIAVGGGFLWVSVYYTNREGHFVLKIDPRTDQILGKIFLAGTQPLLHAGKDALFAWGEDLRPGWTGRTMIWKIPY